MPASYTIRRSVPRNTRRSKPASTPSTCFPSFSINLFMAFPLPRGDLSSNTTNIIREQKTPSPFGCGYAALCQSSSERAVPRVVSVNPTHRICRNELYCHGSRLDGAFVPDDVHVFTTSIDKPHPLCVHSGLAVGIVPLIGRDRSRRDDDQAGARVRVPAGRSS